jgi:hypothetical protein
MGKDSLPSHHSVCWQVASAWFIDTGGHDISRVMLAVYDYLFCLLNPMLHHPSICQSCFPRCLMVQGGSITAQPYTC